LISLDLNVQVYGKCHSRSYAYATKLLTHDFKIKVFLTSTLKILVKDSKIEIIAKFYVKKITFSSFKVLNASIPRQNFFFKIFFQSTC